MRIGQRATIQVLPTNVYTASIGFITIAVGKFSRISLSILRKLIEFLMNMFDIAVLWLVVPLKTFQKFCGLNADRFGKIAGSVELRPVPLCYEFTDRVDA